LSGTSTEASHQSTAGLTTVAALGHHVVVRTTTPAARRAVESLFRNMREPRRASVLRSLALQREHAGWIVSGGSDAGVVYASLPQARVELRETVTRLLMSARPDLLWLHASSVARDGCAVLISGPSGSGKSVLATRLIEEGFAYLGDDVLPLDPRTRMVYPFPITPAVRCGVARYLPADEARSLRKRDVVVTSAQVATGPLPVAAIVFPMFVPGPSRTARMSPGRVAFELLRQCRDFRRHGEDAVRAMSTLAGTAPAWTLSFADTARGAEAIVRATWD